MKTTLLLFLFLFSFSILSAVFIDHDATDTMSDMREYKQASAVYFIDQSVRYYLETDLFLPTGESYRWLSGGGGPTDLHDGDHVCEGEFRYRLRVNARARNSGFDGKIPMVSGSSTGPGSWTDCGPASYCPEGNKDVLWSSSFYNSHLSDYGTTSGRQVSPTSVYGWRSISIRESGVGPFHNDEAEDIAVVMKGSTRLRRGSTTIVGPRTLTGTSYSYAPGSSSTFGLYTGSFTQFTFTQRVNVDGGLVAAYNSHGPTEETYWPYQDLGNSQDNYYTETVTSPTSRLNIYDEDNVGVIPPSIVYVDLGNDGVIIGEPPYETAPGEEIPVKIIMWIPDRPDNFYPLSFEFNNVGVSPSSFSFDEESGIDQCSWWFPHINGGWFLPFSGYSSNIIGTLTVPNSLGPGVHPIQFRVHWETCNGQEDCDGNGDSGWTEWVTVNINIPDDDLPDLICEVVPTAYIDAIAPGPDGFEPGQGVVHWEVTVTNIGEGSFDVPDGATSFCAGIAFQAYSSDGTEAFDPFYSTPITATVPDSIPAGESRTFNIYNANAVCEGETGEVRAEAWVNFIYNWDMLCIPYTPAESNIANNYCEWELPCTETSAPGECTIVPSNVNDPPSGSIEDFDLYCDGSPCTGTVDWDTFESGDHIGDMTDSGQLGATVEIVTYTEEDELSGYMVLEATIDFPDNMICNATITLNDDGPGDGDDYCDCDVYPTPQLGAPGSHHEFSLICYTDEDPGGYPCAAEDWDITQGNEYVALFTHGDQWANVDIISNLVIEEAEEAVHVRAEIEEGDCTAACYGIITLPPMDCFDYI